MYNTRSMRALLKLFVFASIFKQFCMKIIIFLKILFFKTAIYILGYMHIINFWMLAKSQWKYNENFSLWFFFLFNPYIVYLMEYVLMNTLHKPFEEEIITACYLIIEFLF